MFFKLNFDVKVEWSWINWTDQSEVSSNWQRRTDRLLGKYCIIILVVPSLHVTRWLLTSSWATEQNCPASSHWPYHSLEIIFHWKPTLHFTHLLIGLPLEKLSRIGWNFLLEFLFIWSLGVVMRIQDLTYTWFQSRHWTLDIAWPPSHASENYKASTYPWERGGRVSHQI